MLKLGTQTGSLINHVLSTESCIPEVGMGATLLGWTDRSPATVIAWNPNKKEVTVQEDNYTRQDMNGMSECQDYSYTTNIKGQVKIFRWTDKGWRQIMLNSETHRWVYVDGEGLYIGQRERYYDFSF